MRPNPSSLIRLALTLGAAPLAAQSGGFVATLGRDTVHVERFTRFADRIEGTVVTRSPQTRVVRYVLHLDPAGVPTRYEVSTRRGDGTADTLPTANGTLTFSRDSVQRDITVNGAPSVQRFASSGLVVPGPMLPYVGVSYLMYEIALREARTRADSAGLSNIRLVTMHPRQAVVQPTRAWIIGADSAELDYFGVARSGYRFDREGRLLRADWTGTTYRYRVSRVEAMDIDAISRAWAAADTRGASMGALSPRDSTSGRIGATEFAFFYGRPSKRGRVVWGEVVPHGRVWRLGADLATEMSVSTDVRIGGTTLAAGRYSLWMLTSADGTAQLIVNRQTRIFGTQYNPQHDIMRVPLERSPAALTERLTLDARDGRLRILWDDVEWSIPVTLP